MKDENKQKVLFLCTGNSARSQIAEALLRDKAGDKYQVYSAGTCPETIDLRVIDALEKFNIHAKELVSQHVDEYKDKMFDYVITLCEEANNACRTYPNAVKRFSWDLPDAKKRAGNNPFITTLDELSNRISMFLLVEDSHNIVNVNNDGVTANTIDSEIAQVNSFEPIAFYKSLTDDIRLKTLMLTHYYGELCVCELMEAMAEGSQPKVSRNLAVLKKSNVITDRKHGQWVFYRINPKLPLWAKSVIAQTTENNIVLINNELQRLASMQNRPDKASFCK